MSKYIVIVDRENCGALEFEAKNKKGAEKKALEKFGNLIKENGGIRSIQAIKEIKKVSQNENLSR